MVQVGSYCECMAGSTSLPEQFKPGYNYSFPKRKFGKGNYERSFQAGWYGVTDLNGYIMML